MHVLQLHCYCQLLPRFMASFWQHSTEKVSLRQNEQDAAQIHWLTFLCLCRSCRFRHIWCFSALRHWHSGRSCYREAVSDLLLRPWPEYHFPMGRSPPSR